MEAQAPRVSPGSAAIIEFQGNRGDVTESQILELLKGQELPWMYPSGNKFFAVFPSFVATKEAIKILDKATIHGKELTARSSKRSAFVVTKLPRSLTYQQLNKLLTKVFGGELAGFHLWEKHQSVSIIFNKFEEGYQSRLEQFLQTMFREENSDLPPPYTPTDHSPASSSSKPITKSPKDDVWSVNLSSDLYTIAIPKINEFRAQGIKVDYDPSSKTATFSGPTKAALALKEVLQGYETREISLKPKDWDEIFSQKGDLLSVFKEMPTLKLTEDFSSKRFIISGEKQLVQKVFKILQTQVSKGGRETKSRHQRPLREKDSTNKVTKNLDRGEIEFLRAFREMELKESAEGLQVKINFGEKAIELIGSEDDIQQLQQQLSEMLEIRKEAHIDLNTSKLSPTEKGTLAELEKSNKFKVYFKAGRHIFLGCSEEGLQDAISEVQQFAQSLKKEEWRLSLNQDEAAALTKSKADLETEFPQIQFNFTQNFADFSGPGYQLDLLKDKISKLLNQQEIRKGVPFRPGMEFFLKKELRQIQESSKVARIIIKPRAVVLTGNSSSIKEARALIEKILASIQTLNCFVDIDPDLQSRLESVLQRRFANLQFEVESGEGALTVKMTGQSLKTAEEFLKTLERTSRTIELSPQELQFVRRKFLTKQIEKKDPVWTSLQQFAKIKINSEESLMEIRGFLPDKVDRALSDLEDYIQKNVQIDRSIEISANQKIFLDQRKSQLKAIGAQCKVKTEVANEKLKISGSSSWVQKALDEFQNLLNSLCEVTVEFPFTSESLRYEIQNFYNANLKNSNLVPWFFNNRCLLIGIGQAAVLNAKKTLEDELSEYCEESKDYAPKALSLVTRALAEKRLNLAEYHVRYEKKPQGLVLFGKRQDVSEVFELIDNFAEQSVVRKIRKELEIAEDHIAYLFKANPELKNMETKYGVKLRVPKHFKGKISLFGDEGKVQQAEKELNTMVAQFRTKIQSRDILVKPSLLKMIIENPEIFFKNLPKVYYDLPEGALDGPQELVRLVVGARTLSLCKGSIATEEVDAIVNPANSSLNHGGGIAGAISIRGGPIIHQESEAIIRERGKISIGEAVLTSGGDLPCRSVIHAVVPFWNEDPSPEKHLRLAILNSLHLASSKGFQNISIPPLACGLYGFPPDFGAVVIISEILGYFKTLEATLPPTQVRIIITDDQTIEPFRSVFNGIKARPSDFTPLDQMLASLRAKYQGRPSQSTRVISEGKSAWSWREDDGKYYEYSPDLSQKIEEAYLAREPHYQFKMDSKKYLEGENYVIDFRSGTQKNTTTGYQRGVQRNDAIAQQIEKERRSAQGSTQVMQECSSPVVANADMKSEVSFRVYGQVNDLDHAVKEITAKKAEYWKTATLPFDQELNISQKERCGHLLNSFEVDFSWNGSTLTLQGLGQNLYKAQISLLEEKVKMREAQGSIQYPSTWMAQNENLKIVPLQRNSEEWKVVENRYAQTLDASKIVGIERIQNRVLWRSYLHEKQLISEKLGTENVNEKLLFHGTRGNDPKMVYNSQDGFDMKFCESGMWGRGNYFAVNASYSYAYKSSAGNGIFQMFMASVIAGDSHNCAPDSSLKMPPVRPEGRNKLGLQVERFDSVNGTTGGSLIYIVYNNKQSYPTYLITFAA